MLTKQLSGEEATGWIYCTEHDTNAEVLFVQAKQANRIKVRRILNARDRNEAVDYNHTPLPSMGELMELVAVWKY